MPPECRRRSLKITKKRLPERRSLSALCGGEAAISLRKGTRAPSDPVAIRSRFCSRRKLLTCATNATDPKAAVVSVSTPTLGPGLAGKTANRDRSVYQA
jgi:hypothetical protein